MLRKLISPFSYRVIKLYREKYITKKLSNEIEHKKVISDANEAAESICNLISSSKPCMISRFGSNELDAVINYRKGHPLAFMRKKFPFWVNDKTKSRMQDNAGFFPVNNNTLSQFADLIIDIAPEIDILGSWIPQERMLEELRNCKLIKLMHLEPFWATEPWTALLKDKKILIVHPFEESIRSQYERRELLFKNKDTLPKFAALHIIKAVQSIGGVSNGFDSWFDALKYMENQIDNIDYDIALIGCGAYGMPLAAHCKQMGKQAVHLGGALQLLFGIRGARWEADGWDSKEIMNEYWVRPLESERPPTADAVENACYW